MAHWSKAHGRAQKHIHAHKHAPQKQFDAPKHACTHTHTHTHGDKTCAEHRGPFMRRNRTHNRTLTHTHSCTRKKAGTSPPGTPVIRYGFLWLAFLTDPTLVRLAQSKEPASPRQLKYTHVRTHTHAHTHTHRRHHHNHAPYTLVFTITFASKTTTPSRVRTHADLPSHIQTNKQVNNRNNTPNST